ncbi:helix-turn-helix domain-containing protein [Lutimonas zeaxanthinifaciens]|uniref:helix-turn-helix domain-containing protein n=1 Tax=Lutimonas zeaxanthinifaciens TaxID=3060215 RepID=UPI00265C9C29|nr:helix-turn-helix domain-containing protein [Lutimonas sp. YSD2104]WKK67116.1 helix-turn-helix domain-containing protein [Lutimonas sp. YSD2104]
MNSVLENTFLISSILGILISLVMMSQIFRGNKADFFLGLVVFMMGIEILFSWGVQSGYVNSADPIRYWKLLNYLVFPPALWIFVKYNTDDNFQFQSWHYFLFFPAIIGYAIEIWSGTMSISLMEYPLWIWYSDYLPMVGTLLVIGYFWIKYFKLNPLRSIKIGNKAFLSQLRLLLLMLSLTLICVMWIIFNFIGWKYYYFIEFTLTFMFLGFALLNFLENQSFPSLTPENKNHNFPNYNDKKSLELLELTLKEQQHYLKPNFPLKELASELNLPQRYVSFLINHYHDKNYKEFINEYRIKTFLSKAQTSEKDSKTLLGLALESGFSSKSTFNQVFKNYTGKSPSEYLKG